MLSLSHMATFRLLTSRIGGIGLFSAPSPFTGGLQALDSEIDSYGLVSNLFEDFPQLCLQLYIIRQGEDVTDVVFVSMLVTVLALLYGILKRCLSHRLSSYAQKYHPKTGLPLDQLSARSGGNNEEEAIAEMDSTAAAELLARAGVWMAEEAAVGSPVRKYADGNGSLSLELRGGAAVLENLARILAAERERTLALVSERSSGASEETPSQRVGLVKTPSGRLKARTSSMDEVSSTVKLPVMLGPRISPRPRMGDVDSEEDDEEEEEEEQHRGDARAPTAVVPMEARSGQRVEVSYSRSNSSRVVAQYD